MTDATPMNANDLVERRLDDLLARLEHGFDADGLCIIGDLVDGLDDHVRLAVEDRRARDGSRPRLAVILTTDGGFLETVQRIVDTMRRHYPSVIFIVPNRAFSAGTVLAMSGNEIHMDYYSRLGPTDPQSRSPKTGRLVPALGYVEKWDELLKKANQGTITSAEAVLMIDGFDQAELYQHEQAKELSVRLVTDWLTSYKFKDWTRTETRRRPVSAATRKRRARTIAEALVNTRRWHSHGHGISRDVLWQELRLRTEDLDGNAERSSILKQYDGLLSDYMTKIGYRGIIHSVSRLEPLRFVS